MALDLSMSESKGKILDPSSEVRGMKNLNKKAFSKTVQVRSLKVSHNMQEVFNILKPYLLKMPSLKPAIVCEDDPNRKEILLNPEIIQQYEDFPENIQEKFTGLGFASTDLLWKDLTLEYDNWKADVILKHVLPLGSTNVTGFSVIGHIVHLNLKEEHFEYKTLIGTVLLDKLKNIRTVVNKVSTIDNTYRNFAMEVLAGDNDTIVTVKENGVLFRFDFAKVYWNPRLSTEHNRFVSILKPNDILFDVFAGVGPFAVPAARKNCYVFANDLNPESSRWLTHNAEKNKVGGRVKVSTLDGRDFILRIAKPEILKLWQCGDTKKCIHIVMNLPALAIEFLDVFPGLFIDVGDDSFDKKFNLPFVHCYCFVKDSKDQKANALAMAEDKLKHRLTETNGASVSFVRNVAPNKDMVRISFQLSKEILIKKDAVNEPELKKIKLDE